MLQVWHAAHLRLFPATGQGAEVSVGLQRPKVNGGELGPGREQPDVLRVEGWRQRLAPAVAGDAWSTRLVAHARGGQDEGRILPPTCAGKDGLDALV